MTVNEDYQRGVPGLPGGLPGRLSALSALSGLFRLSEVGRVPGVSPGLAGLRRLSLVLGVLLASLQLSGRDEGDVPVPDADLVNMTGVTPPSHHQHSSSSSDQMRAYLLTGCQRLLSQSLPHSHNISYCLAISD